MTTETEAYMIGNETFIHFDGEHFVLSKKKALKVCDLPQRNDILYLDQGMLNEMFSWLRTNFKLKPTCPVCGHIIVQRRNLYRVRYTVGGTENTENILATSKDDATQKVIGDILGAEIKEVHLAGVSCE